MTAQEQQCEDVVLAGVGRVGSEASGPWGAGRVERRNGFAAAPRAVGAPGAYQRTAGHREQRGPRPLRDPFGWPLHRGREQCLPHRVLAGAERSVPADQRGEDLRRGLAQQPFDLLAGHRAGPCAQVTAARSGP